MSWLHGPNDRRQTTDDGRIDRSSSSYTRVSSCSLHGVITTASVVELPALLPFFKSAARLPLLRMSPQLLDHLFAFILRPTADVVQPSTRPGVFARRNPTAGSADGR